MILGRLSRLDFGGFQGFEGPPRLSEQAVVAFAYLDLVGLIRFQTPLILILRSGEFERWVEGLLESQ